MEKDKPEVELKALNEPLTLSEQAITQENSEDMMNQMIELNQRDLEREKRNMKCFGQFRMNPGMSTHVVITFFSMSTIGRICGSVAGSTLIWKDPMYYNR